MGLVLEEQVLEEQVLEEQVLEEEQVEPKAFQVQEDAEEALEEAKEGHVDQEPDRQLEDRGLYLAPHIPCGLRRSPGDFPESTWSPGAFFLAGSTAKLACIIHLDFTWTPGGVQMNHMESVESTCQIAVWILPGLNPGSIHQESRRSLFSLEFIFLYF